MAHARATTELFELSLVPLGKSKAYPHQLRWAAGAERLVREWEIEDRRSSRPPRKSLGECWRESLIDIAARRLHESTTRKYKLIQRQMQEYAGNRGLQFIDEFDLSTLSTFRSVGTTVPVQAQRS